MGRFVQEKKTLCRAAAYRKETGDAHNHNQRNWNLRAFMTLGQIVWWAGLEG